MISLSVLDNWFCRLGRALAPIRSGLVALAVLAALGAAPAAAEDLVKEALASFPPKTARLEYSSPAKLRELPDYAKLRQHYLSPSLRNLETSLGKLGIEETDIDELALGWQSSESGLVMEGLAAGHFNSSAVARKAAAQGIKPVMAAGLAAYCFGAAESAPSGEAPSGQYKVVVETNSPCVMILSPTLGAFGVGSALRRMAQIRGGQAPSLNSNSSFVSLVTQGRRDTPIWGVATGPAVVDWFKGWMPSQKNLQLDWQSQFQSVQSLAYSVKPKEQVELDVQMDCTSAQSAGSLRQVFDGLKLFQQVAWQQQNPGRPNPFQGLAVDSSGPQVLLTLNTPYAALEGGVSNQ